MKKLKLFLGLYLVFTILFSASCKRQNVRQDGEKVPLWKLRRILREGKLKERVQAVKELGKYRKKAEQAISILRLALRDPAREVREEAVKSLGDLGEKAVPALIETATGNAPELRELAFEQLEGFGPDLPRYLKDALGHPYWKVRLGALILIGKLKPRSKSIWLAVGKLLQDPEVEVRIEAAKTLGKFSPPSSTAKALAPEIAKALRNNRDWWRVRLAILEMLQAWGKLGANAAYAVVELLGEDDQKVVSTAKETLKSMGQAALPALIQGMTAPMWQVKVASAELIAQLGKDAEKAVPALEGALEDSDIEVRKSALRALAAIGPASAKALPSILKLIRGESTSPAVRKEAVLCLFSLGEPGLNSLKELLSGDDWLARKKLMDIVGQLGEKLGKKALPFLRIALTHREEGVRIVAAIVLSKLGPKASSALPELIQVLRARNPTLRKLAAKTLGNIGLKTNIVINKLKKLTRDPVPEVREEAKRALEKLKAEKSNDTEKDN